MADLGFHLVFDSLFSSFASVGSELFRLRLNDSAWQDRVSSFPCFQFAVTLSYANFVRHPTIRRAASGELFRDDETSRRTARKGRSLLFHCQLSLDDIAL